MHMANTNIISQNIRCILLYLSDVHSGTRLHEHPQLDNFREEIANDVEIVWAEL